MVNLICFFVSLVLNLVASILNGVIRLLGAFIVSPIRTTSRVLQTVASLGMVGAIVTVVILKWKAPRHLDGMNWWQFGGAIAAAFAVVVLTQWVLDRPTYAQRRTSKNQSGEHAQTGTPERAQLTNAERARLEELEAAELERKKVRLQESVDRLNRLAEQRAKNPEE